MQCSPVRFSVTILALGYLAVAHMTVCTMEIRMFGMILLQVFIDAGMA